MTARNMPALGNRLSAFAPVVAKTWVSLNVSSYVRAAGIYSFAITTPGSTAISLAAREIRRERAAAGLDRRQYGDSDLHDSHGDFHGDGSHSD